MGERIPLLKTHIWPRVRSGMVTRSIRLRIEPMGLVVNVLPLKKGLWLAMPLPPSSNRRVKIFIEWRGRAPVVRRRGGGWDGNSSRRGQPNGKGEEQTRRHIFSSDCCIWDRKLQTLSPKPSRMQPQMDGDTMGCKFHGRSWSGCAYPSDRNDALV